MNPVIRHLVPIPQQPQINLNQPQINLNQQQPQINLNQQKGTLNQSKKKKNKGKKRSHNRILGRTPPNVNGHTPIQPQVPTAMVGQSSNFANPQDPRRNPPAARAMRNSPDAVNFSFDDLPRVIIMTVGDRIQLDLDSDMMYQPGHINYPSAAMRKLDLWHQVVVHHMDRANRNDIELALFRLLKSHPFFPIGYRGFKKYDTFLLTASDRTALEELFRNNLFLALDTKLIDLRLSVRVGAGKILSGHMHPKTQLAIVARKMLEKATAERSGELDFESFAEHPELREVVINFSSTYHVETILKAFAQFMPSLHIIKVIRMARCNIESLETLRSLDIFPNLQYLSLSDNNIRNLLELKNISHLRLVRLDVARNPFLKRGQEHFYYNDIKRIIPSLKVIDDMEVEPGEPVQLMPPEPVHDDFFISNLMEGELIGSEATDLLQFKMQYKSSPNWHKVIVSDIYYCF